MRGVREDIKKMKPGDKLPSQRELIDRFGFASQTIWPPEHDKGQVRKSYLASDQRRGGGI